jgi:hypothetical protein
MGKVIVKVLLLFSPALCVFGPLIIVVGFDPLNHTWADIGALMTGAGSLILLLKILSQSKEIEELSRQLRQANHH